MNYKRVLRVVVATMVLMWMCEGALAANNPVPLINLPLNPTAVAPGGAGFTLTVNGTGFVSGAVVNWNGSARATTFVSSSQVTATIPGSDIATAGTAVITVTNPGPGGGKSNGEFFQVANPTVGLAFRQSLVPSGVSTAQSRPVVGDFNGDGKPDLVINGADNVYLLLGNGDGTFQTAVSVVAAPPGGRIDDVAAGDFNGDGKLDIAVSYYETNNGQVTEGTSVVLGNGDGTFQAPVTSAVSNTLAVVGNMTLVADVNGDGIPDLVRACQQGICVELGNGDGTFQLFFTYTPPPYNADRRDVTSVAVGDFNGDGKLDIAFTVAPQYLDVMLGNGDGTFAAPSIVYNTGAGSDFVVAGDFDGDGKLDLAFAYGQNSGTQITESLSTLRGNGDGTFQAPLTLPGFPRVSINRPFLIAGDFNGDGHLDLAVEGTVVLIESLSGQISYRLISTGQYASTAADFNGDGKLDLVGSDHVMDELQLQLQTAPPGDFRGGVNPNYQTIVTGGTATYTITITAVDGFTGTVQFSTSGLPAGATASFVPTTVTGSGSTTLTITTTGATPTGSSGVLLTGTSGSITHSGTIMLNVGPAGADFTDFGGSVQPSYRTITPGSSTTYDISSVPLNGFTSNVSLSVSGLPAGATFAFSPSAIPGGSGSSVLSVTTPGSTPTATYPLTITGSGGGHTHNTVVNLNVGPAGTDFTDFTGSITPESQTVAVGGSTSFTITVQPINGFTGNVSVLVYGDPAATQGVLNPPNPICCGSGSTVLTFKTTAQTPPGTYVINIAGESGHLFHSRNITLTVTP